MAQLALYLFGPPRVAVAGVERYIRRRKGVALLTYLAVTRQPHSRDALATLFWPDFDQTGARDNLRRTLSELHQALDRSWLAIDRTTIRLHDDAEPWVDLWQFYQLLAACRQHGHANDQLCPACLPLLQQAADLYRDDFLAGFTLADSPAFDDWQAYTTAEVRATFAATLARLVDAHVAQRDYAKAIDQARRWVALDPLHEPAQRRLMELYARSNQRTAALRQYEECRQILADELGVLPAPETTALHEQIRARKIGPPVWAVAGTDSNLPHFLATLPSTPDALPPFVAREHQLSRLHGYLDAMLASKGGVIFIQGEAGQGKTSLINAFARQAQTTHPDLIVCRGICNVYTGVGDPYLPFREILQMLAGDLESPWAAGTLTRAQALNLWHLLPHTIQALLDHGPTLLDSFVAGAALLGRMQNFPLPQTERLRRLQALLDEMATAGGGSAPDQTRLFEAYTAVLASLARHRPLLIFVDDLHWADLSSLGLLFHLGRKITNSRILIVSAYRPEDLAQLRGNDPHPLAELLGEFKRLFGDVWVDLTQAAQTANQAFVDALLDIEPNQLGLGFRRALAQHTGGHPLFLLELLRDMKARGDLRQDEAGRWVEGPKISWDALPARVEGVISRRIDRLDAELRQILTVASVEGEAFTAEVVARVQAIPVRSLVGQLSGVLDRKHRLVKEEGLVQIGGQRRSRYLFQHNLFQQYIYHHLSHAERVYLHEAVGAALETLYEDAKDRVALQLAHHFKAAGVAAKAVDYLLLAGQQAIRLSANHEAIVHLREGLTLLKTQTNSPQRNKAELTFLLALAVPVSATEGYAAPTVAEIYTRAHELAQHLGQVSQLFQALFGLFRVHTLHGKLRHGLELSEQILQLAQTAQSDALLVEAHRIIGVILFHLGELVSAQRHLESCMAMYNVKQHGAHAFLYGHDPAVTCLNYAALNLWILGYPDKSLARSHEILQLAQETLSHPFSLAYTLVHTAWLHQFRREVLVVGARAEAAITLARDKRFPQWLAFGNIFGGWALTMQGNGAAGLEQMQQGLAQWQAIGIQVYYPQFLALLAEAYRHHGQLAAALTVVDDALALTRQTDETWWNAELYRLKGELLWQLEHSEIEVEPFFQQAIALARQQQARSLELRAVMSLCRLWQQQGKRAEAHQILTEIYSWFTEGFDTMDLSAARTLLDALSAAPAKQG